MHPIQIFFLTVCLLNLPLLAAQTVGEVLPDWTPGILDIHEISTGRGCATFSMLPDGTTLLYDAGGDAYQVIILDDSDESGRITAIHGPYETL